MLRLCHTYRYALSCFLVPAVRTAHTISLAANAKKKQPARSAHRPCRLLMKHSYAYILYCANISARYVWNFIIYLNGLICQYFFSDDVLLFVILLSVDDFLLGGCRKLGAVKGGTCSACLALDCSRLACIIAVIGGILNPPCVSPEQLTYWGACFCLYLVG